MRKLMILAAMLAMAMAVAVPAFAQQTSGAATSGGATLTAGDLANQCVQVANNVNSGNVSQTAAATNIQANIGALTAIEQNATASGDRSTAANAADVDQNVTQNNTATQSNTITQDGIDQVNNAQATCNQAIAQVQAPGEAKAETPKAKAEAKAEAPKAEAKAGEAKAEAKAAPKAEAKAEAPKAEAKAGEAKAEAPKTLPATGGVASLLALGAGALLVGGALVARRIIR